MFIFTPLALLLSFCYGPLGDWVWEFNLLPSGVDWTLLYFFSPSLLIFSFLFLTSVPFHEFVKNFGFADRDALLLEVYRLALVLGVTAFSYILAQAQVELEEAAALALEAERLATALLEPLAEPFKLDRWVPLSILVFCILFAPAGL